MYTIKVNEELWRQYLNKQRGEKNRLQNKIYDTNNHRKTENYLVKIMTTSQHDNRRGGNG